VTETVPTMNKGQTLDVKLVYTFTTADASLGKITFKANVSLLNARDALPADNDAIEAPTAVKPSTATKPVDATVPRPPPVRLPGGGRSGDSELR